jgi:fructose-bisphosphate aldolase class 1
MTIMANDKMTAQISSKDGFIAALDQSGGSTPGALRLYGIPDSAYSGEIEMFRLVVGVIVSRLKISSHRLAKKSSRSGS